ncbi:hypothetical protein LM597_00540 [Candidatus Acetothermia bacterium]|nr:hypothetical protein [Candidatus Acetothermia bacterium]
MRTKEQLVRELERLPEDLIEEMYDFVVFMRKQRESRGKRGHLWGNFSLSSGAFDFWNNQEEMEYSLDNLMRRP